MITNIHLEQAASPASREDIRDQVVGHEKGARTSSIPQSWS